jgi:hypothetical protein
MYNWRVQSFTRFLLEDAYSQYCKEGWHLSLNVL